MGSARLWPSALRRPEISCRRLCRISLIEACNTRSRSGKPSPLFFLDGGLLCSESGIAIVVLSTNRAQTHPRGQVQIPRALTCCGIRSDKQRGIVILLNLTWPRFENESAKPHYSSLRNPGKFGLGTSSHRLDRSDFYGGGAMLVATEPGGPPTGFEAGPLRE